MANGYDMAKVIRDARRRRARALRLREAGHTVEQVGNKLGITKQRASELIRRARQERQPA